MCDENFVLACCRPNAGAGALPAPRRGRAGRRPVAAARGGRAARSSMAGDEIATRRLTTSARGCACLKFSPTRPCRGGSGEIKVLAGAGSSTTRGSESSSYSTSTGRADLNNSTITRLRATHRGQCSIAVRYGRSSMLRPHRGQFICPWQALASTCLPVLIWSAPSRWAARVPVQAPRVGRRRRVSHV
jgi:hypothetical protein